MWTLCLGYCVKVSIVFLHYYLQNILFIRYTVQVPHWLQVSRCFLSVDEETNEAWDNTCNSFDNYEELKENIYGKELEQLFQNSVQVCFNYSLRTKMLFSCSLALVFLVRLFNCFSYLPWVHVSKTDYLFFRKMDSCHLLLVMISFVKWLKCRNVERYVGF